MSSADSGSLIQTPEDYSAEVARARKLAERYRLEFVDMDEFRIDQELFRSIPADLMLRYGFVPWRRDGRVRVGPAGRPLPGQRSAPVGRCPPPLAGARPPA